MAKKTKKAEKAENAKKAENTGRQYFYQSEMTKERIAYLMAEEAKWKKREEEREREIQELKQRYDFLDAMNALRYHADPKPLMWHLRNGQPVPPEHAEQIAALFDPHSTITNVVAKVSFRKKGHPKKAKQQREIYNAVMYLRGNDWDKPMPPGAWDVVAAHFKLSRKTVETAYQSERAEVEEYRARPDYDLDDEETAEQLRAAGWNW